MPRAIKRSEKAQTTFANIQSKYGVDQNRIKLNLTMSPRIFHLDGSSEPQAKGRVIENTLLQILRFLEARKLQLSISNVCNVTQQKTLKWWNLVDDFVFIVKHKSIFDERVE